MTNCFLSKQIPLLQHLLIILLTFSINFPLMANQDDWVLVDRFNRQLSAAKAGKVKAMYEVGRLYERGRGTKLDLQLATQWYQSASDAGQPYAQSRLGIMYFEGRGVKQNYNKALKLLNAAAKENVPSAQYQLANMYELGTGVSQDLKQAIHWYSQSDKYGYYLAKAKVTRLTKVLAEDPIPHAAAASITVVTQGKVKRAPSALVKTITSGQWIKRKKSVGYLPSNITNCVNDTYNSLHCISTSQERSTGSEIITYNTESDIKVKNNSSFNVVYSNNVLEVTALSVENGDGVVVEQTPSRIKKGTQGKKRTLNCVLKNKNLISCSKGSSSFDLISR
ncbi:MAG: sel1 repeat family protein [Gammaproteobacteria bacterium]|nr:sel1 repeat family protein [Gammaproteobacteria bacterium]